MEALLIDHQSSPTLRLVEPEPVLDQLPAAERINTLAGHLNAVNAAIVDVVAEILDTGAWAVDGIRSANHWLCWQLATLTQGIARRSRFVVSGMAGCGKTALAGEAARQLVDAGDASRVVFADLRNFAPDRPAADPAAVRDAIVRTLGGDPYRLPAGARERRAEYSRLLVEHRAVLILDDAASADQVGPLLPDAGVLVLVTSRNAVADALRAVDVSLGVLSAGESAEYLRVAAAGSFGGWDPESVDELVDAVGRLPLALTVIASRIARRPDWTIADHTASLVSSEGQVRVDDAVTTVLDQSHAAMSAEASRALRLVASLPFDDIGLDGLAATIGYEVADLAAIADELFGASMATRPASGRIGLHALVRAHARERSLDEDRPVEREAALAALLDQFAATCRAAATAVLPDRMAPPRYATKAFQAGDWDTSLGLLLDVAAATVRLGQASDASRAHDNIAVVMCHTGDLDGAAEHHELARTAAIEAGDMESAASALSNASEVHRAWGETSSRRWRPPGRRCNSATSMACRRRPPTPGRTSGRRWSAWTVSRGDRTARHRPRPDS